MIYTFQIELDISCTKCQEHVGGQCTCSAIYQVGKYVVHLCLLQIIPFVIL